MSLVSNVSDTVLKSLPKNESVNIVRKNMGKLCISHLRKIKWIIIQ
jgi:hypothetical protein